MKLSIFTTYTDPEKRNDPWKEALNCFNDIADEVIVTGSDWPEEFTWSQIGKYFQQGLNESKGDWNIRMDIDYFFHEKDVNKLSSEVLKKSLSKKFSPEFLNRIDEIVVFNQLTTKEIEKIAKIEINNFIDRLKEIDYDVKIDSKVLKFISVKGFDKEFGARPIKRAIQKHLEDPLAKKIVSGEIKKGHKIEISHVKDSESLDIKIS